MWAVEAPGGLGRSPGVIVRPGLLGTQTSVCFLGCRVQSVGPLQPLHTSGLFSLCSDSGQSGASLPTYASGEGQCLYSTQSLHFFETKAPIVTDWESEALSIGTAQI